MSFEKVITSKIKDWKSRKIISEEQSKIMIKDINNKNSVSSFLGIIGTIGALFLGIGILLLIASNWNEIPKIVKLLLALMLPILSIGSGYFLSYVKREYEKIGDPLIFLGGLLIGAALALISQIYNFDISEGTILLIWAILTIPLTFLFGFRSLSFMTIVLFYLSSFFIMVRLGIRDEYLIILFYIFISTSIFFISYIINKKIDTQYSSILEVFWYVSLKVLIATLFIAILSDEFFIFGENLISAIIQHLLFLGVIFTIIWFSNKNFNKLILSSAFFWLGAYMFYWYILIFFDYAFTGFGFILIGLFLMLIIFLYIKISKYLLKFRDNKI